MSLATTVVSFGEWLPDAADLGGTGMIVAKNVLPIDGGYNPFLPLDSSGATLPAQVNTASFGYFDGNGYVYAHDSSGHTMFSSTNATVAFTAIGTISGNVSFAQFDNLMLMASDQQDPKFHTISSSSGIATLSASALTTARCIGVVNNFAVLGDLGVATRRPSTIRWSAIDDPTNWPDPNSATAIATQAGEQDLNVAYGEIQAIHGGDQHAILLQKNAVTRMTYVGPPVVFQFDMIDNTTGSFFRRGSVQVGNIVYFISADGICRTDGVTVQHIGRGRVDKFFWNSVAYGDSRVINCGYDPATGLIYFGYSTSASAFDIDRVLIYNPTSNTFSYADQDLEMFLTPISRSGVSSAMLGFGIQATSNLGRFQATAGSATLETSDIELNPSGRAFISGVKPNVESIGTAPAVTVRVAARNDLGSTPTYTATTTPTTRTGIADVRVDAKYHRAEVQIIGQFTKATGLEFKATPSGEA